MPRPAAPAGSSRWAIVAAGAGIALAALVAYHNSFGGPFVLDDVESIAKNHTLRQIGTALTPPSSSGMTVAGRPVLNFTLALNYAFGAENVGGYHAVNLLIHGLTALLLFGVIRRTLERPGCRGRFHAPALPVAFVAAVLWAVHPLTTAAVTYVIQRAEALAAFFFLLTLYGFIRGLGSGRAAGWSALAVAACALGMASKETMVSAPLIVLLYDRTFAAGSFRGAWQQRGRLHAAFAATWILLAVLVAGTHGRGGSAGFATAISPWSYALTQSGAIAHYLWLAVWPHPLVFDYGTAVARGPGEVWPGAALVLALLAGTVWALRHRPAWGFLGAFFFAVLAPSSSLVPIATQTVAEHRFYLPLAAVVVAGTMGIWSLGDRRTWGGFAALIVGLAALTVGRNRDYRSALALWTDTAAKYPANARAHLSVGAALTDLGRAPEALPQFAEALRLDPNDPRAHTNQGLALAQLGRHDEAIRAYETSLRLRPANAATHNNLGESLAAAGRPAEAVPHFAEAVRLMPDDADLHCNLANALFQLGAHATPPDLADIQQAIAQYRESLRLNPRQTRAHNNLGVALDQLGRTEEAMRHYEQALAVDPDNADAHDNLGGALAGAGRLAEAAAQFERVLQTHPQDARSHYHLGGVFLEGNRLPEAIAQFQAAVRLQPAYPNAYFNLAHTLAQAGRGPEAIAAYERAAQLTPTDPEVHNNLGVALAEAGRLGEAIREFEATLRLKPDHADARRNLQLATAARRQPRP